ncbi:MAG: TRAP transporter substrate-binding protein DctP [Epsilonproteobacteria bacterium]|nr:TRAP transporter substrate-binding protein DctP [Campylobacterota bacterium]
MKIKVYPAQELGNDHQMVELAREGKIDILLTPMSKMSIPIPPMQHSDLPFFFPKREDLYAMLDGEVGERLLAQLKSIDLVGVTFWENGFKHFSANAPITSPDDFKGKKVRIMKSRIIQE